MTPSPATTTSPTEDHAAALRDLLDGIDLPSPTTALPAPAAADSATPVLRDDKGRFLRGTRGGPGPPSGRGVDIKLAAERIARERGIDLPLAVGEVVLKLIEQAKGGDVQAAVALFKAVGISEDAQQAGISVVVVTGVDAAGAPGIALRVNASAAGDT